MKKIIAVIVIIVLVLGGWFLFNKKNADTMADDTAGAADTMDTTDVTDVQAGENVDVAIGNTNNNTNTNMSTKTAGWEGTYVSGENTIVIEKSGSGFVLTYTGPNAFYFKGKKQVSNGTVNSKGQIEARLDTKANGYNGIPSAQAPKNGDLIYTLTQAGDKIEYNYIDSSADAVVYSKK